MPLSIAFAVAALCLNRGAKQVIVRAPRDSERIACRMLLPEAARAGGSREFCLAIDETGPWIVGAVSFQDTGDELAGVRLHVVHTDRRRGIGSLLLRSVIAEAKTRGRGGVAALADPTAEQHAPEFLLANGFQLKARLLTVEASLETACRIMVPVKERVLARRGLPPSTRIEPLSARYARAAADLYADYIALAQELRVESFLVGREFAAFDRSSVLLIGDHVQGVILGVREQRTAVVHARIVAPAYRGGGASAVFLAVWFESARDAGMQSLRFETADSTRDTLKFMERVRGRVTQMRATFVRPIPLPDATPSPNASDKIVGRAKL